ncbi:MAG: AAA family ATPase, partial [Planctomycetia bacterium]
MSGVLRVAIVDPNDGSREQLRNMLLGIESVYLEAESSRYEYFVDLIQQSTPDVAIITLDENPDQAMHLIDHLRGQFPTLEVMAGSSRTDGQFILNVMRRGVKAFLALPVNMEELLGELERISTGHGPSGESKQASKVYAFSGARGGVGSTSIAVNVGTILAQNPLNSVVLVDLDLTMGDADVCMDVVPDYTLADIVRSIDRVDLQLLKRSLCKHSSGLYLLPHPVELQEASSIHEEHVARILTLMKMQFSHLILDLSKGYSAIDFAAMEVADEILLVIQLDVSNLRNVVRLMLSFSEREGLSDKVKVVANRVGSDDREINIQKAEETIGRKIFSRIPNDSRTMMDSRNNGVPLLQHAPKSRLFQSLQLLAGSLS